MTTLLHKSYPWLVPTDTDLKNATASLEDAYQDYIKHVSPSQMTIALETSAYILWAAGRVQERLERPIVGIDYGSGFTSYVLRKACGRVWSVDDSSEWLEWTRRFLERHDVYNNRLCLWDDDDYRAQSPDVVVYDFSSGEMRDNNFQFAIGQVAPGGIAILDDANHEGHQKSMHAAAKKFGYDLFGLQDWTRDYYKRFAAMVVVP